MTKIEQKTNPRTGEIEVFLNGKRLETILNDNTDIQLEILKNILEIQDGDNSFISIKKVLLDIYDRIGNETGEEIDKLKKELLVLIQLLDKKIEESRLVAGKGIIIEGNVVSTTTDSYIEKLISDYEKLQNEYNKLLTNNEQLEGQNRVLNNRLEHCNKENQRLNSELDELTLQYEKALIDITKLNKEIKKLEEIIASGEDYKMYKKYKQLYYRSEAEVARLKQFVDDLTGETKRKQIRNQEQNRELFNKCCICC